MALAALACGDVEGEPIVAGGCVPGTARGGGAVGSWICVADIDGSGVIDLADLPAINGQFGCSVATGDSVCDRADVTRDCEVNVIDFDVANAVFGQQCVDSALVPDHWPCAADTNGDGTIDANDEAETQASTGCAVGSGDAACDASDVDRNGNVDAGDRQIVHLLLGRTCPG
jgi:hypothetical protein